MLALNRLGQFAALTYFSKGTVIAFVLIAVDVIAFAVAARRDLIMTQVAHHVLSTSIVQRTV